MTVVIWRLRASYASDIETICDAEAHSGISLGRDMAGVAGWIRAHLTTAEGNAFYTTLADVPVAARAKRLEGEAAARHLPSCPLAVAYEGLLDDGRYRADMQHLAADERAETLERWIAGESVTPRMRALGPILRAAATPRDRARILNEAAHGVDVLTCDTARDLLAPDPSDAAPE